jgi:hypothetical protein
VDRHAAGMLLLALHSLQDTQRQLIAQPCCIRDCRLLGCQAPPSVCRSGSADADADSNSMWCSRFLSHGCQVFCSAVQVLVRQRHKFVTKLGIIAPDLSLSSSC